MFEEVSVLRHGIVLGLAIAAPLGPVGLLCIRRSVQKGAVIGLATGFGAAMGDALFGAIAVLGISAILDFIHHYAATIRIIGGLIVLATAWHTWGNRPKPPQPAEIIAKVLNITKEKIVFESLRALVSGFIITLTNPLTLFGTIAVVATFGGINGPFESDLLISGIFAGSVLWWVMLSGGISLLRGHFTEDMIALVNRVTAVCLALLAVWALAWGIKGYLIS